MEPIRLERRGAVVIARFPPHPSPDAVHEFFDQMERLLQQMPLGLVLDAAEVRSAPISVRDAAGRRLKVMEPLLRRALRAQATVVASPLVRGALATVHFFAPPKYPVKSFSDLPSAIRWVEERVFSAAEI